MKKTLRIAIVLALIAATVASLFSCAGQELSEEQAHSLWDNATYKSDTTLGSGSKTVTVQVKVGENTVNFTLKTDKATLGEALMEHSLIEGEAGAYGLYIKKVNGITADYDVDQSYWGIYKNGEYLMTGVDTTNISNGEHYELIYEK